LSLKLPEEYAALQRARERQTTETFKQQIAIRAANQQLRRKRTEYETAIF